MRRWKGRRYGKKIGIGNQDFATIRKEGCFYIDKTHFIQNWWENADHVTLVTRPGRFGKTLNMSMPDYFFSIRNAGKSELFEGLSIWDHEKYRKLQGTYPVISVSFATVKEKSYAMTVSRMNQILTNLYSANKFLMEDGNLDDKEKNFYASVNVNMDETTATMAIHQLSIFLSHYYGKKLLYSWTNTIHRCRRPM